MVEITNVQRCRDGTVPTDFHSNVVMLERKTVTEDRAGRCYRCASDSRCGLGQIAYCSPLLQLGVTLQVCALLRRE